MEKRDVAAINPDDYKLKLTLRIDWSEMDMFGHVNNVMYVKYMQAARVHLWEHLGMKGIDEQGIGPMLASTQCQFIRPLFYPGNVRLRSKVTFLKNSSFGIEHLMINDDGRIAAIGSDVAVHFNFHQNTKVVMDEVFREKLERYL